MYCQKCGKEINDEAVICVGCGCPVKSKEADVQNNVNVKQDKPIKESSSMASTALLFAFLIPIAGLIMGIIGTARYKTTEYKHRCISAIVVSVVMWIVYFVILTLAMGI